MSSMLLKVHCTMQTFKNAQVNFWWLNNTRTVKQQWQRPNVAAPTSEDRDPNSHESDINSRTKLSSSCCLVSQGTMSTQIQYHTTVEEKSKKLNHLGTCLYFVLQYWTKKWQRLKQPPRDLMKYFSFSHKIFRVNNASRTFSETFSESREKYFFNSCATFMQILLLLRLYLNSITYWVLSKVCN